MGTLPKPQTSDARSEGRFGKQDFRYVAEEDIYICPAGEKLAHHFTNEENGWVLRRYWTNACRTCALKAQCTKGPQRRITRWEHEYVVDAVQARLKCGTSHLCSGACNNANTATRPFIDQLGRPEGEDRGVSRRCALRRPSLG